MEPNTRCTNCGQVIPWGQTKCPFCSEHRGYFWSLWREGFLLVVFTFLVILFVITGFTVKLYHAVESGLAQDWYSRGEEDLHAGRAEAALVDFRNALAYSRENALMGCGWRRRRRQRAAPRRHAPTC